MPAKVKEHNDIGSMAPVFIIGVPRSGTTLLRVLLDSHSKIAGAPETPWILGGYGKHSLRELTEYLIDNKLGPVKNLMGDDEKVVLQGIRAMLDTVFSAYLEKRGKEILVLKTPDDIRYIDFLLKLYPHSKYIHIYRDGRDVACSTVDKKGTYLANELTGYGELNHENAMRRWYEWEARVRVAFEANRQYSFTRISYEDLVERPEAVIRKVCEGIGVEYEQGVIDYQRCDHEYPEWEAGSADVKTRSAIDAASVGRWKYKLGIQELEAIEAKYGDFLKELGYHLSAELPVNARDLIKLQEENSQKDELIEEFEDKCEKLTAELALYRQEIARKAERIEQYERDLEKLQREVSAKSKEVSEKSDGIATLQKDLDARAERMAFCEIELTRLNGVIQELGKENEAKDELLLRQESAEQIYINSLSWRLTRPLRLVYGLLHKENIHPHGAAHKQGSEVSKSIDLHQPTIPAPDLGHAETDRAGMQLQSRALQEMNENLKRRIHDKDKMLSWYKIELNQKTKSILNLQALLASREEKLQKKGAAGPHQGGGQAPQSADQDDSATTTKIEPGYKGGAVDLGDQLTVVFGNHRSGWGYAISNLAPLHHHGGIYLDTFIERTFVWRSGQVVPTLRPWIGFIHVPPNVPEWFQSSQSNDAVFATEAWQESYPYCRGLFTLSEYHKQKLEEKLDVPINALLHPTEMPHVKWEWKKFEENRDRKIVQVGWWLRKLHAIFEVPKSDYKKVFLRVTKDRYLTELMEKERAMREAQGLFTVSMYDTAQTVEYLKDDDYDRLISENIIFAELYDSSANNLIIECLVRDSPLLVNPLEPVVEYLGKDYPFYFTSHEEAIAKAQDLDLVYRTHLFLKEHPVKKKLTGDYFLQSFKDSEIFKSL